MDNKQQDRALDQVLPLTDEELLLRLHFSPEHICNGKVAATAISTSDLKQRGYSLDRKAFVEPQIIADRALTQGAKNPEKREKSYLSQFECGSIRDIKFEEKPAFEVKESPTCNNPAHAHILSAQKLGEGALRRLRILLLPYLDKNLMLLDEYMQQ
ncbi:hypothetical protein NG798_25955 [Ancylothrix sp. C2]|uniref:hypothetical protein n=1 Tax=Ancylothrix sp. D3o TaxID=2953691 RepID=UPI0021BAAF3F|nr:hypothetical protein [Ancylothrix sp. D3o]MCT7953247.1 hypothetical protein [Ancylothrix sp. D3o]